MSQATVMDRETALPVARGLGWFSIGLGLAELLAPRALARELGMPGSEGVLQLYGLREIATGVAILASDQPAPWVWGRVAGDALDIATLSKGLNSDNPRKENVGFALAAVVGVTLVDAICAHSLSNGPQNRMVRDFSNRSGFPRAPGAMIGAARDAEIPRDMRTPEALRPWPA